MLAGAYAIQASGPDYTQWSRVEGQVSGIPGGRPEVTYVDSQGVSHVVEGAVSSRPPAYDIGERVDVLYDPEDPSDAQIDSFLERYFATTILSI